MSTLFKNLENAGYIGTCDVNLQISLFEYGLLHRQITRNIYEYIAAVGYRTARTGEPQAAYFDTFTMTAEEYRDQVKRAGKSFLSFTGQTAKEAAKNFPYGIRDLIAYQGTENTFGSTYYPLNIRDLFRYAAEATNPKTTEAAA